VGEKQAPGEGSQFRKKSLNYKEGLAGNQGFIGNRPEEIRRLPANILNISMARREAAKRERGAATQESRESSEIKEWENLLCHRGANRSARSRRTLEAEARV